ncbi:MAG: hypothetical protein U0744_20800 [Gemmataceae bacterium]
MLDTRNLLTNARRFVSLHAERLGLSLLQLREQLRDAIAHRVATAVAEAVQSVAQRVLGQRSDASLVQTWSQKPSPFWNDPTDLINGKTHRGPMRHHDANDDWREDDPTFTEPTSPAKRVGSRELLTAVAIAAFCSMLSWLGVEPLAKSVRELAGLSQVLSSSAGFLTVYSQIAVSASNPERSQTRNIPSIWRIS